MSKVECIAITSDCRMARCSYIGVMVHWIDPFCLEKLSAALACKQFQGSHSFEVLANALDDRHLEYLTHEQIIRTTVNNSLNFVEVSTVFSADK